MIIDTRNVGVNNIEASQISANSAKLSETNAASSATNAATQATNASTSASNAKTSETNAKTSETNSKTSETNVASSASYAYSYKSQSEEAANLAVKKGGMRLLIPNETTQQSNLTVTNSDITEIFENMSVLLYWPFDNLANSTLNINSLGSYPIYFENNNTTSGKFAGNTISILVFEKKTIASGCWKAVRNMDNTAVHLTGDETISGTKTFSNKPLITDSVAIDSNGNEIATTSFVKSLITKMLLDSRPIGSIEIRADDVDPGTIYGGTWTKISQGRVLQGKTDSQTVGSTLEAGLPNITGGHNNGDCSAFTFNAGAWGAIFKSGTHSDMQLARMNGYDAASWPSENTLSFDASKSNVIYGRSSTVQPPAFLVNIWKRTA